MRFLPVLVLSLAFLAPCAGPAAAATDGDTLSLIWKPLPNIPTILRPGDTLTVWAHAPAGAGGWSAALRLASRTYPLTPLAPAGSGWQTSLGWWVLSFGVPEGVPEELYDLTLTCGSCSPDVARHAVKVITAFKDVYYFAQISDTHLPQHTFSSDAQNFNPADTTGMADFDTVIEDLNLIHPEFILHTGDLVNEAELQDLGMDVMGSAKAMISRLRDPMFLVSGNHDIGGWQPTLPPAGSSRKNWWRYFGWPILANPPAGYPYHSQDYSFDYGRLHCIGLEGYENDGQYDNYLPGLYGAQSMTQEQMDWLAADVAAAQPAQRKLAFIHYDFGGTDPYGYEGPPQFADLWHLGLSAVIWGHNHGVPEGNLSAYPLNLGLQSVIDRRVFRIFHVRNGAITPGPMHYTTGIARDDSLHASWVWSTSGRGPTLTATVTNEYGETWDHARLLFSMPVSDSGYVATGGTIAQVVPQGSTASVYVDYVLPAAGTATVSVTAAGPTHGAPGAAVRLDAVNPNPYRASQGLLSLNFSVPVAGRAKLAVYDLSGRLVSVLFDGPADVGDHSAQWNGRSGGGASVKAGIYLLRLQAPGGDREAKVTVIP